MWDDAHLRWDAGHDSRRVRDFTVILALACALTGVALGATPSTQVFHSVDTALCPFTLDVKVVRHVVSGSTAITLRNNSTGRTATLDAAGSQRIWLAPENRVPYLSTDGGKSHPRVIDPCALVATSPPPTQPAASPAPWGVPAFALSHIAYAGLNPVIGRLIRHDHVHLDIVVDGRKITIPAGVGQVEPVDRGPGPCPPLPESRSIGDCAPGHYFTAKVALSPLHPHTTSGIVHIESDRRGTFTLGQFFDEWGVRFDSSCIGGYCTGEGKELRVFVDGKGISGDPRSVVLTDRQEIAVVFGGRRSFRSVPSSYGKRWPVGCGGPAEPACIVTR
jgi:hypothetical protein